MFDLVLLPNTNNGLSDIEIDLLFFRSVITGLPLEIIFEIYEFSIWVVTDPGNDYYIRILGTDKFLDRVISMLLVKGSLKIYMYGTAIEYSGRFLNLCDNTAPNMTKLLDFITSNGIIVRDLTAFENSRNNEVIKRFIETPKLYSKLNVMDSEFRYLPESSYPKIRTLRIYSSLTPTIRYLTNEGKLTNLTTIKVSRNLNISNDDSFACISKISTLQKLSCGINEPIRLSILEMMLLLSKRSSLSLYISLSNGYPVNTPFPYSFLPGTPQNSAKVEEFCYLISELKLLYSPFLAPWDPTTILNLFPSLEKVSIRYTPRFIPAGLQSFVSSSSLFKSFEVSFSRRLKLAKPLLLWPTFDLSKLAYVESINLSDLKYDKQMFSGLPDSLKSLRLSGIFQCETFELPTKLERLKLIGKEMFSFSIPNLKEISSLKTVKIANVDLASATHFVSRLSDTVTSLCVKIQGGNNMVKMDKSALDLNHLFNLNHLEIYGDFYLWDLSVVPLTVGKMIISSFKEGIFTLSVERVYPLVKLAPSFRGSTLGVFNVIFGEDQITFDLRSLNLNIISSLSLSSHSKKSKKVRLTNIPEELRSFDIGFSGTIEVPKLTNSMRRRGFSHFSFDSVIKELTHED